MLCFKLTCGVWQELQGSIRMDDMRNRHLNGFICPLFRWWVHTRERVGHGKKPLIFSRSVAAKEKKNTTA